MTRPLALLGVLLALVLTGCGTAEPPAGAPTGDPATTTAPSSAGSPASAPAGEVDGISEPPVPPEVPDLLDFRAKTIEGEVFEGRTLLGAPAVLWFWAPWCPTCQAEAPTIAEVATTAGVRFVGVAAQDELPAMRAFVDEFGLGAFPHLADTGLAVWQRFGVEYQPAYAFVTSAGEVEVETELLEPEELTARVRALG